MLVVLLAGSDLIIASFGDFLLDLLCLLLSRVCGWNNTQCVCGFDCILIGFLSTDGKLVMCC